MKIKYILSSLIITLLVIVGFTSYTNVKAKETYPSYAFPGSNGITRYKTNIRKSPDSTSKKIDKIKKGVVVYFEGDIITDAKGKVFCKCRDYNGYIELKWLKSKYYAKYTNNEDSLALLFNTLNKINNDFVELNTKDELSSLSQLLSSLSDDQFIQYLLDIHKTWALPEYTDFKAGVYSITDNNLPRYMLAKEYEDLIYDADYFEIFEQRALDIVRHRLVDTNRLWTVTGKPCIKNSFETNHGCTNCDLKYIMNWVDTVNKTKCSWYDEVFPEFEVKGCNCVAHSISHGTTHTGGGQSCLGFGNWCNWYTYSLLLGRQEFSSKGSRPSYANGKFTKDFISKNARPGDVIRLGSSHTVVVYSIDNDGIWVIDANSSTTSVNKCNNAVRYYLRYYNKNVTAVIARPITNVQD